MKKTVIVKLVTVRHLLAHHIQMKIQMTVVQMVNTVVNLRKKKKKTNEKKKKKKKKEVQERQIKSSFPKGGLILTCNMNV